MVLTSLILEPQIFLYKRKLAKNTPRDDESTQESTNRFNNVTKNKRFKVVFVFWLNITALYIVTHVFMFKRQTKNANNVIQFIFQFYLLLTTGSIIVPMLFFVENTHVFNFVLEKIKRS